MNNKRTYIIGSMVFIVLLVGLFSFRIYKSTDDQEIENTITEFFKAFYTVTPDTIDLIISESNVNGEAQSVMNFEKYAESTYKGLYTSEFYKTFLVGDRYMILAPQLARDNNLTISFKKLILNAVESSDDADKYYTFEVEIMLKNNVSGTEEILINEGQVSVKQDFFKYKILAIKFFDDKLVSIEIESETNEPMLETHYLTLKDITDCPFYRPDLTIEMAQSEGLELIETVSGIVYGNEWVEYTFSNWAPTPFAMTIKSNSEGCSIMGIQINDPFETALSLLPQDYDWKSNFNNLIYGSLSDGVTPGEYFHGGAYIDDNGLGTITLVPNEYYPFVQFIISDNKVEKINVLYYEI